MRDVSKFLLAATFIAGCATDGSEQVSRAVETDGEGCVKIEGSEIGQVLSLDVLDASGQGTVTVTFTSWTQKTGESEYVGFDLDTDARFFVKAGNEVFNGSGASWVNPNGTSGPDAHGISYVTVCSASAPPPPPPPPPDGCDNESGTCDPPPPPDPCDLNGDGDDTDEGECHYSSCGG